jgi:hypothetical protein
MVPIPADLFCEIREDFFDCKNNLFLSEEVYFFNMEE